MSDYFLGVDPGANGGAGLLGAGGEFVRGWRYRLAGMSIINELSGYAGRVQGAMVEHIQIFRQLPINMVLNMQSILVNMGWWCGVLDSLGVSWELIKPVSWQSRLKCRGQDRVKLAASLWPGCGVKVKADDGLADGLLIAEVCRVQYLAGAGSVVG